MLDIKYIKENAATVKKVMLAKQLDPLIVDELLRLDGERRELIKQVEGLRKRRNQIADDIKKSAGKPAGAKIEEGKKVKKDLQRIEPRLAKLEEEYLGALKKIPNPPAEDVKVGEGEGGNEVIRTWSPKNKPSSGWDFKPKNHWELGESLDIIDTERGSKVSGARFFYLKGDGFLLEYALLSLALETLLKEGFIPVVPPVLIRRQSMEAMGYLEYGGEEDMFTLEKDGLVLVGTSEQSLGPLHKDEVIKKGDLPRRYMGYSSCFRREAGSYGKDTRGAFRVHQFNKIEMFSYVRPEDGDKEHEYLLSLEEKFLQMLEIPYQVSKMCTGDLGFPAARKYDLNGWFPGQGKYRELTSTSTTTDFQSRRLNIKYQDKGKTDYVHTLNGTAFAQRSILSILENYQERDGSVVVPEVLRKWVGKDKITQERG
jgi:seryl-tRNA synthetase